MTPEEQAKKIFEEERYPFRISVEDADVDDVELHVTTAEIIKLETILAAAGVCNVVIEPTHQEFLGWDVETIKGYLHD